MYSGRTIPKFEVDVLFQEIFTQKQKKYISRILILLGKFGVLETRQLYSFYKNIYGENLKLQFLKKAVKEKLIIEYKKNLETKFEEDVYFYQLKTNSYYILDRAGQKYIPVPYFAGSEEKSQMLGRNEMILREKLYADKNLNDEKDLKKLFEEICLYPIDKIDFGEYTKATNPKWNQ